MPPQDDKNRPPMQGMEQQKERREFNQQSNSIFAWLIIIGIAIGGYFFLFSGGRGRLFSSSVARLPEKPAAESENTVKIENFTFLPEELRVGSGGEVVWENQDNLKHSIVSDSFSSPDLNRGDKYSHRFDKPGEYDYHCGVHPFMTGRIIVE